MQQSAFTSRAHACSDRGTRTESDRLPNGSRTVYAGCLSDSPLFPSWRMCVILGGRNSGASAVESLPMDFDALFTQVIALLQREQRISYRVLKRRFALSDDDLADLKD